MDRRREYTPSLWPEEGVQQRQPVASVVPAAPFERRYSFVVPERLRDRLQPGQRVRVPVGRNNRLIDAFVIDISERPWDSTLKPIDSVIDDCSFLGPSLLKVGEWLSEYYAAPLGKTFSAMVPSPVRQQSGFRTVRLVALNHNLEDILAAAPRLSAGQRRVLQKLSEADQALPVAELCRDLQVSPGVIRRVIANGWAVEQQIRRPAEPPDFDRPLRQPDFQLNTEQRDACRHIADAVDQRRFRAILLYGVSGSGKTEVYIDAMNRAVAHGRQVIVLVPEIALTTQLVERFASRFRDVAVIHSGLTPAQRSLTWMAIRDGRKRVVIGTRSAVFAPCTELGLVVIDEEQEPSYKNQQMPRFHARDAAVMRARLEGVPVVLGSATPSLETWHTAHAGGDYQVIHLRARVGGLEMPAVELVDLDEERHVRRGHHLLSRLLEHRLGEVLTAGQQAVILLNRRGYAHVLYCPRCHKRVLCANCRANMVWHRGSNRVVCHHCGAWSEAPRCCADPSCAGPLIRLGMGTERVEEELRRKFPEARIRRVDSDTMTAAASYHEVMSGFEHREFDIMVGTQMVAKGLDFPWVALVGVIDADTSLVLPDFRANERTFQLVTQVAGRAGRVHQRGRVVVQSSMSGDPLLQAAAAHDYDSFAAEELEMRRKLRMPPFTFLARWVLSDQSESVVQQAASEYAAAVRKACYDCGAAGADVTGPLPSPLERMRRRYRYDVLLRADSARQRSAILHHLRQVIKPRVSVKRIILDVDPVSLL